VETPIAELCLDAFVVIKLPSLLRNLKAIFVMQLVTQTNARDLDPLACTSTKEQRQRLENLCCLRLHGKKAKNNQL